MRRTWRFTSMHVHKIVHVDPTLTLILPVHTLIFHLLWKSTVILFSHLCLGLPSGFVHSGFPTRTLCSFLPSVPISFNLWREWTLKLFFYRIFSVCVLHQSHSHRACEKCVITTLVAGSLRFVVQKYFKQAFSSPIRIHLSVTVWGYQLSWLQGRLEETSTEDIEMWNEMRINKVGWWLLCL